MYAYMDYNPVTGYGGTGEFPSSINLAGVNSISVTWNAPAGYMYVVTPPPITNGPSYLFFGLAYGLPGNANSLGSVTGSSAAFNLVYGTSPASSLYGSATINTSPNTFNPVNGLDFSGGASISPTSSSFAFTSFTITSQFSGAVPAGILSISQPFVQSVSNFDIGMYGGYYDYSYGYHGAPDPGALLTLEPVTTPEPSSVALLSVAAAVYFARRKMRP